ncbi:hypothetical protein ACWEOI_16370 [Nocardia sp. NPDC004340]
MTHQPTGAPSSTPPNPPPKKQREPMTRAHRLQLLALAVTVIFGISSTYSGFWGKLFHNEDLSKGNATNYFNQTINMPAPSGEASPADPHRGCSNTVDDSTGGWGPARIPLSKDDLLPWPGFNQDNLPGYGDERNFYTGSVANATTDEQAVNAIGVGKFESRIKVERGKYYVLMIYIHNSAGDADGKIATNTRAKVNLPTCTGRQISSNAFITSDNAQPGEIYDGVSFWSDEDFNLAYVAGSARMCNNFFTCRDDVSTKGVPLPDDILTSHGALLGYDKLDGKFRGNYKYSAYIYLTVRPQFAPS